MYGDGKPKEAGTWDWYGACDPNNFSLSSRIETFTLGIFQWKAKIGKGTKRGKVVYRVKGYVDNPQEAYTKANEKVEKLNVRSE